jgi:hypothetical protein
VPLIAMAGMLALSASAGARPSGVVTVSDDFAGPLFGVNNGPGNQLLVADAGAGPTRLLPNGSTHLITRLPGVSDVDRAGPHALWALVSAARGELYKIVGGHKTKVADLTAFENRVNPANDERESNPFDLAGIGFNRTLIADAAGNSVLIFNRGKLDWVASLPQHRVSTQPLKDASGCPSGPPDICNLPPFFDADPVATSVALGPDGANLRHRADRVPGHSGHVAHLADRPRHAARALRAQQRLQGRRSRVHLDRRSQVRP